MQRLPEPELMNDPDQVMAYSQADFAEAHQSVIHNFSQIFPDIEPLNASAGFGMWFG